MRRVLLFLVSLAFIPVSGYAQITYDYGIKAGVGIADIQASDVGGGERRLGAVGGGFIEVDFIGTFAAQVELLYTQKGDSDEVQRDGRPSTSTVRLDYLEVPMLLKLQGPLLGDAEVSVYGGPALAFKLSEAFVEEDPAPGTQLVGTIAKRQDLGVALGVEFGVGVPFGRVILDFRFTPGLSEIREDAELQVGGTTVAFPRPNASNSVFSVMGGVTF